MKILFDLQILHPDKWKIKSDEEAKVFREIWNMVYERILILKDQIEKEEEDFPTFADGKMDTAIYINLTTLPMMIIPKGYTKELTNRILCSFSQKDIELLWKRVENMDPWLN